MQEVGNIGHTESFNVHRQFRFLFYTMTNSKSWDVTSKHTSKNITDFFRKSANKGDRNFLMTSSFNAIIARNTS
jgi:hypothetical protein